jgi:hypothetical protein
MKFVNLYDLLVRTLEYGHPYKGMEDILEGHDLNMTNKTGMTVLMLAAQNEYTQVVLLLMSDPRVDVNLSDDNGMTALYFASREGDSEIVSMLLANQNVRCNVSDSWGITPLMIAAWKRHTPVVKMLLADQHVDPTMTDWVEGSTALDYAIHGGRFEYNIPVLELLLADHRVTRIPPDEDREEDCIHYEAALFLVKYRRRARFKGLVRAVVVFRRMRLRAAEIVYAPGGTGFTAAESSFNEEAGKQAFK